MFCQPAAKLACTLHTTKLHGLNPPAICGTLLVWSLPSIWPSTSVPPKVTCLTQIVRQSGRYSRSLLNHFSRANGPAYAQGTTQRAMGTRRQEPCAACRGPRKPGVGSGPRTNLEGLVRQRAGPRAGIPSHHKDGVKKYTQPKRRRT